MGILQARILGWLPCPPSEDFTNPRFEPRSPTLQADSLPFESPGKLHRDTLEKLFVLIKETILYFTWDGGCAVLCIVTQLCLTLCDPMDYSPPGFSAHGILQARTLEWVVMPSSGVLTTQGLNPCFLHCRQILHHLSHQGSLRWRITVSKERRYNICLYRYLYNWGYKNKTFSDLLLIQFKVEVVYLTPRQFICLTKASFYNFFSNKKENELHNCTKTQA